MTAVLLTIVALAAFGGGCLVWWYRDSRESDAEHVVERLTARLARGSVIPVSKVRMRGRHRRGDVS